MRYTKLILAVLPIFLVGCAESSKPDVLQAERADYRSSSNQNAEALTRPPRIITDAVDELLAVESEQERILPQLRQARIVRAGNTRWAEIDMPVEKAWPIVRQFWLDQGFAIESEIPEAGIIETDWQTDRAQVLGTGLTQLLDNVLERLHDTGERHKFRTRVERGVRAGTTQVFISFRGIVETTANQFDRLPHDPTLEAEMLRRMLLAFRLPDESLATVAALDQQAQILREYEVSGSTMAIQLPYRDAWLRIMLALDRAGFTIEGRDYDQGLLTVVYVAGEDQEDDDDGGFFVLFRGDDDQSDAIASFDLKVLQSSEDESVLSTQDTVQGAEIIALIAANF